MPMNIVGSRLDRIRNPQKPRRYHRHEGIDLRLDYAKDTLKNLYTIWTRPVHLRTVLEGKGKLFTYDGEKHLERKTDG